MERNKVCYDGRTQIWSQECQDYVGTPNWEETAGNYVAFGELRYGIMGDVELVLYLEHMEPGEPIYGTGILLEK